MSETRIGIVRPLIAVLGVLMFGFCLLGPGGAIVASFFESTFRLADDDWRTESRLRADQRFVGARSELAEMSGSESSEAVPHDARAAVWLERLTKSAPAATGGGEAVAPAPVAHEVAALKRLRSLDDAWSDTVAQRIEAATILSHLTIVTPAFDGTSDAFHQRALVAVALARASAPDHPAVRRSTALVLSVMGYAAEAKRQAAALPAEDIVRAYTHRDYETLHTAPTDDALERFLVTRALLAAGFDAPTEPRSLVSDQWARTGHTRSEYRNARWLRLLTVRQYPQEFRGVVAADSIDERWEISADDLGDGPWLTPDVYRSLVHGAYALALSVEARSREPSTDPGLLQRQHGELDHRTLGLVKFHTVKSNDIGRLQTELEFVAPKARFSPAAVVRLRTPRACVDAVPLRFAVAVAKRSDRRPSALRRWRAFLRHCGDVALAERYRDEVLDGDRETDPFLATIADVLDGDADAAFERMEKTSAPFELKKMVRAIDAGPDALEDDPRFEAQLRRLVEMRPSDWSAREPLLNFLEQRGRLDDALEVVEAFEPEPIDGADGEKLNPFDVWLPALRTARYLRRSGRVDAAWDVLQPHVRSQAAAILAEAAWIAMARGDAEARGLYLSQLARYDDLSWVGRQELRATWRHVADDAAAARTAQVFDGGSSYRGFVDAMELRDDAGFTRAAQALAATNKDFRLWIPRVAMELHRRGYPDRAIELLKTVPSKDGWTAHKQGLQAKRLAHAEGYEGLSASTFASSQQILNSFSVGLAPVLWGLAISGNDDVATSLWTYRVAIERTKEEPDAARLKRAEAYLRDEASGWYGDLGRLVSGQMSPKELTAIYEDGDGKPIEFHYWMGYRHALDGDYDAACHRWMNALMNSNRHDAEALWVIYGLQWFREQRMSLARMSEAKVPPAPNARPDFRPVY